MQVLEIQESERIQRLNEEKQKSQKKKRIIRLAIVSAAIFVIFAIVLLVVINSNGYSADNISIKIVSKINDKYNENLADGYIGAGYYYTFGHVVSNDSPNDIRLIRGTMEVFDSNGNSLSTSTVEMQGKLQAKSSATWNIQLNVSKGDNARKIWNSSLEELKITFRIKAIYFGDGTEKSYDVGSMVIHEPSKRCQYDNRNMGS